MKVDLLSNRESPCRLGAELAGTSPRARLELTLGDFDHLATLLTSIEGQKQIIHKMQLNVKYKNNIWQPQLVIGFCSVPT